jgi:hypothetical protein
MITLIGLTVLCIILYIIINRNESATSGESFVSRSEKADRIMSWFDANLHPTYDKFKHDLMDVDAVDYGTALKLKSRNQLDLAHLKQYL